MTVDKVSKYWSCTLNNYGIIDEEIIEKLSNKIFEFSINGREVRESGTHSLQCYLFLKIVKLH